MPASSRFAALFASPLVAADKSGKIIALDSLNFALERQILLDTIKEGAESVGVCLETTLLPATTDSLRSCLTLGSRVIHYAGHGHPDFLSFEDGRGGVHAVDVSVLGAIFAAGGKTETELVLVSACYSRRAGDAFVAAGIRHVVCVNVDARVRDRAALTFTRAFYLALIAGKTVSESFDIGRVAVLSSPDVPDGVLESKKFLLLPQSANHNRRIFADAPKANSSTCALQDKTPQLPINNLPTLPDSFIGRTIVLQQLIADVLRFRLVTVTAPFGAGKTALALAMYVFSYEILYLTKKNHFLNFFQNFPNFFLNFFFEFF
eukprot:GSMAST32.ASY1.ANO1.1811.1 assembled CDS